MYTMTAKGYETIFEGKDTPGQKEYKPAIGWTHCPSCDTSLPERIFPGDEWECIECGESGTRQEEGKE